MISTQDFETITNPNHVVQDGDIIMYGKRKIVKVVYPQDESMVFEVTVSEDLTREERIKQMADLYNFLWSARPAKGEANNA